MTSWFRLDPARLEHELASIHELCQNEEYRLMEVYLKRIADSDHLVISVDIEAHGYWYELEMQFPAVYPLIPPAVFTRDKARISSHQFLNGQLCLDLGPDNWDVKKNAKDVLEGAKELLQIENPSGTGDSITAPTRDVNWHLSHLEGQVSIFFSTKILSTVTSDNQDSKSITYLTVNISFEKGSSLAWLNSVLQNGQFEEDDELSFGTEHTFTLLGVFSHFPNFHIDSTTTAKEVTAMLFPGKSPEEIMQDNSLLRIFFLLYKDDNDQLNAFIVNLENNYTIKYIVTDADLDNQRLPPVHQTLESKTVCIVGLGSVGSKIALTLARSQVKNFILIDRDYLLPGNLVRHALSGLDIGQRKISGVARSIKTINSRAKVIELPFILGDRTSISHTEKILQCIKEVDLIIDTTANLHAFPLLSGIAEYFGIPMVWSAIYEGGIGGFIARFLPGENAPPLVIAQDIKFFWHSKSNSSIKVIENQSYDFVDDSGETWTATDSEVSIIAHYAADMALDTMFHQKSKYDFSVYLIGLKSAGIFRGPFDVFPLDVTSWERYMNYLASNRIGDSERGREISKSLRIKND